MRIWKVLPYLLVTVLLGVVLYHTVRLFNVYQYENEVLKKMVDRLQADSRLAEVLVTKVEYDEKSYKNLTTIKFLEYDASGVPLLPKYFTFAGNIIQFQSLVIRFDDLHIRNADRLRGKSAYIFWKAFMLDGRDTQEFEITLVGAVPEGYKVEKKTGYYEKRLWEKFWRYVLDPEKAKAVGIKNAQIEAPGTMFVPGVLYTIKIEHDGGIRIDSQPLAPILRNEKIL